MSVWTIADLHLSFGVPNKNMDVFGSQWANYTNKIQENWKKNITDDDLILIPGDISWAMRIEDVLPDLKWIHALPGTKVLLKGNHDYWWGSLNQIEKILPPSLHLIQNNVFHWKNIGIAGARLWDTSEYSFNSYIEFSPNPRANLTEKREDPEETEKIFARELGRLEMSLKHLTSNDTMRIAMTHFPPISARLEKSRVSTLLEKYGVTTCVFGHLHSIKPGKLSFGEKNNIRYFLSSCDYLDFQPIKVLE